MKFLVNPPARKRRASPAQLRARKKFAAMARARGRAARAAKRKVVGKSRRRVRRAVTRRIVRRRKVTTSQGGSMAKAKRRRRRSVARATPRRRRRRSATARVTRRRVHRSRRSGSITLRRVRGRVYRTNPGFSTRGIIRQVSQAARDGAFVLAGEVGANLVAQRIPFSGGGIVGDIGKRLLGGVGTAMVIRKVVGGEAARFALAGTAASIYRAFAKNLPVIGSALGDDDLGAYALGAYSGLGALAAATPGYEGYTPTIGDDQWAYSGAT